MQAVAACRFSCRHGDHNKVLVVPAERKLIRALREQCLILNLYSEKPIERNDSQRAVPRRERVVR